MSDAVVDIEQHVLEVGEESRPQAGAFSVEGTGSKPQLGLRDHELARVIHAELYRGMGEPDRVNELNGVPMAEWSLVNQGRATESNVLKAYAASTGMRIADEEEFRGLETLPEVTFDYLTQFPCVPLTWDGRQTLLAVANPYGLGALVFHWCSMLRRDARFVLARRTLIERSLTGLYDTSLSQEDDALAWNGDASEEALRDLAREAPIVRLVNDMFGRAVEMGASDVHVEPSEEKLAIRYRVDGVLQTVLEPPLAHYPAIASRIKLLAGLNIAERRRPQDGRIDLQIGREQLDVRTSTVPSMHGESIVLRLLQKDSSLFDLANLGLLPDTRETFESLVRFPHGMVLVVGPTGSGKTTTLYCVMKLLNSDTTKIITIEDPVEYQTTGLTQIQVRPQIGLSFANGLRSIVRQDPDIILVGEIRDRETAEIAIHASLTGHLVLSTLHTNDAAGAISRLLEMEVESFLISSSLLCVLSQRLVRRVCEVCGGTGRAGEDASDPQAKRCRNCQGRGFRGRVGIYELLMVNDEVRRAINEHRDSTEIAAIARKNGMRTLREDGELKSKQGMTSPAEVARACQMDFGE